MALFGKEQTGTNGALAAEVMAEESIRRALDLVRATKVAVVDLKFTDLPGQLQHLSIPADELEESSFKQGIGFDGSSIRGFQEIHESDMLLIPDSGTAIVDPIYGVPTLSLLCNIMDPLTGETYSRDPRFVAQKAENYLLRTGIADVSYWGPEAEFFVFDSIRFHTDEHSSMYFIDSEEGIWNSGLDGGKPNLGYRPGFKRGYFPVPPTDSLQDLRSEVIVALKEAGVRAEAHHHEVGTAGQGEIDLRFAPLVKQGDQMQLYKYILKNVARRHGKTVTFMPKPLFNDNGSGMHCHQSLWKDGRPLFFDPEGYAQLSVMALHYIGGLLEHSAALLAFCAPTTNSYRRLVPGFEAPVNLVYSQRNRSACIRIPMYSPSPSAKRIEYRCPDPSANVYLAFAAMLMAGLDGIERSVDPGDPMDVDVYELDPHELLNLRTTPGSLDESLRALEEDHEFLLRGGVFTEDLIQTWISYKRENEIDPVRLRPHPYEFMLYYDV